VPQKITSVADTTQEWARHRGIDYVFSNETGSTNDDAKADALDEESDFVLYLSAHQTSGRGRGANSWLDTGNGEALLSTWSFRVPSPPQAITGPRVGLALFTAVSKTWTSLNWGLKPPNDLYLDGQKVAGLLVESVSSGDDHRLLIGLGFNVLNHPRKFGEAAHLGTKLSDVVDEGEWFQFLDELRDQFQSAVEESLKPTLSESARQDLVRAVNANPNSPWVLRDVSPSGDLIHADGVKPWTDL
jgi:BirA family biotin operon repressor/biotin-[acetyl-CoA-carboxylase] ligase